METNDTMEELLQAQLDSLKEEQDLLLSELGSSETDKIILMIQNMESQLIDLYRKKQGMQEIMAEKILITGKKKVFYAI